MNQHTPAPIPLAMGTITSPTPVTFNVIHVEETPNTKTPSIDRNKPFLILYVLDFFRTF